MLPVLHGYEVIGEDLVFVVVHDHIVGFVVGGREETVPGLWCVEAIMKHDRSIADRADLFITAAIVTLEGVIVELGTQGFVKKFDGNDDVLVLRLSILGRNVI